PARELPAPVTPEPPPPEPVRPPVPADPEPPAAVETEAPRRVTLRVESVPPGAEVYRALDGVRLGITPYRQEMEPSPGEAIYLVRRPGYRDEKVVLRADHDGRRSVRLEREKPKTVAAPAVRPAVHPVAPPADDRDGK